MDKEIKETINSIGSNPQAQQMLSQISENPEKYAEIVQNMISDNPEMAQNIQNMVQKSGPNIQNNIRKDLRQKLRKNMRSNRKGFRQISKNARRAVDQSRQNNSGSKIDFINIVIITSSRKFKACKIDKSKIYAEAQRLIKRGISSEKSDHLSIGPLSGKAVYVIYGSGTKGNRRATRIFGKPMGGDVVVFVQDHDLSIQELTAVEKLVMKLPKINTNFQGEKDEGPKGLHHSEYETFVDSSQGSNGPLGDFNVEDVEGPSSYLIDDSESDLIIEEKSNWSNTSNNESIIVSGPPEFQEEDNDNTSSTQEFSDFINNLNDDQIDKPLDQILSPESAKFMNDLIIEEQEGPKSYNEKEESIESLIERVKTSQQNTRFFSN